MISKLYSCLFETSKNYQQNLETLLALVAKAEQGSLVVASEVCLSGYDYENFDAMVEFSKTASEALKIASAGKIVVLTMIEKDGDEVFNFAKVFYDGAEVFKRAKARLFRFGDEHKYIAEGDGSNMQIVEVGGIKLGIIICFEIRFKEFWQTLQGCDVIAVCAWWGALRTNNFKTLTESLAVMNQCFVVASDAKNEECTAMSGIITPFGEVVRNGDEELLGIEFSQREIESMRRYMDVGIR